jgi:hypothetical protein
LNNLTKRFRLGEPSKLQSAKRLEGTLDLMRVPKKENRKKSLDYPSLVRPILERVSASWHPCSLGEIIALERVQKKAVQFTNHTKDSDWENLP